MNLTMLSTSSLVKNVSELSWVLKAVRKRRLSPVFLAERLDTLSIKLKK